MSKLTTRILTTSDFTKHVFMTHLLCARFGIVNIRNSELIVDDGQRKRCNLWAGVSGIYIF